MKKSAKENIYILEVDSYPPEVYDLILTENEKKVLRLLATAHSEDYSINHIAKHCGMSPNGAYKLLKKLRSEGVLKVRHISNIRSYKIDCDSGNTKRILEIAFMPGKLSKRVKNRSEDLQGLKETTRLCIIFGSYITDKTDPSDLDLLFVVDKKHHTTYKKTLSKVKDRIPIKIQDVIQTKEDLTNNLLRRDPVVIQAIRTGLVLWGVEELTEVILDVHQR